MLLKRFRYIKVFSSSFNSIPLTKQYFLSFIEDKSANTYRIRLNMILIRQENGGNQLVDIEARELINQSLQQFLKFGQCNSNSAEPDLRSIFPIIKSCEEKPWLPTYLGAGGIHLLHIIKL